MTKLPSSPSSSSLSQATAYRSGGPFGRSDWVRMPVYWMDEVFLVLLMSGRRNSSPLRGLQTNRVSSGSMSKPMIWRAQPVPCLPTIGAVARPSMKSRRRRPSPLEARTPPPRRPMMSLLGSGRGPGSTRWSGTRRWEAHGGSASLNDARSAGDLTSTAW
uniref:Uncharacterized protein n=1 Tax=Arundo donax TaxID=35708 RepID=A0A0A9B1K5_ARUDO